MRTTILIAALLLASCGSSPPSYQNEFSDAERDEISDVADQGLAEEAYIKGEQLEARVKALEDRAQ